ncbi:MAG: hypothetical protein ACXV0U_12080 [Kineosporiaceae bacterium]
MRIPGLGRRRRPDLPADVAQELGVAAERVLAWGELTSGGVAAATVEGRRVRPPQGRLVRRPWTEVDHAAWDEDSGTLAVWWVGSRVPTPLEVGQGTFLPEVIHERVRSSIVLTREIPLAGGRRVYVSLRKAADGTLSTHAVPPQGVRLDHPEIAAAVRRAEAELRDEAGASGG